MRNRDRDDAGNLTHRLDRFASMVGDDSPLYATLARGVSRDPVVLGILAEFPVHQPVPLGLFAAVHHLLLQGERDDLATHYPSVVGPGVDPVGDAVEHFVGFCARHRDRIATLTTTRGVQTNEVRRCATLLPAFAAVHEASGRPLALVEIGPSAGLNLLFDRYRYDYGPAGATGPEDSPLTLSCEVRSGDPPIPDPLPEVASRIGVDLEPVDLDDPDAVAWMRALVWPEQIDRLDRLDAAIEFAREHPPPVVAGDAVEVLPVLLGSLPTGSTPLVFHSYALNQISEEGRSRIEETLREASRSMRLYRVAIEIDPEEGFPPIVLTRYEGGTASERVLGAAHFHGAWLEWR